MIIFAFNQTKSNFFFLSPATGVLDEKLSRIFFHQIVRIVIECMEQNICHRDLKDENILVDLHTYSLKLLDFGSGAYIDKMDCKCAFFFLTFYD